MAELAYALVTTEQIKLELGIGDADTTDDARIDRAIDSATEFCETYCNRLLKARGTASTEYHDDTILGTIINGNELWPNEWPFTSITSLHDDPARSYGSDTQIASGSYLIYASRFIVLPTLEFFTGEWQNVKLVYTPGYSTLPQDLVKAATLITLDFYRLEKNQHGNIAAALRDGVDVTYRDYDINPTAIKILDYYKRDWKMIGDKKAWLR